MDEERLEALLKETDEILELPDEKELTKSIQNKMGKQIYKRIVKFTLLAALTLFLLSQLLNLICYNPTKKTMVTRRYLYRIRFFHPP